jgi:peroxiredoxin
MALDIQLVGSGAGTRHESINVEVVAALEEFVAAAGVDVLLRGRYAVVFAFPGMGVGQRYPDLAGCTLEVCTFIDEAAVFAKHGVAVIGLSGEESEPPEGCLAIPFPVGVIEQPKFGSPIGFVEEDGRRYAERATFVLFPDGGGVRISGITDIVTHVRGCLDVVLGHRLERFRQAAVGQANRGLKSTAHFAGLLPNGADSVAITRVDVTIPLVAKMATAEIVRTESNYMSRINSLLESAGRPRLFPTVVTAATDEEPAWYLMEAADPVSLDQVIFADAARTVIDPARRPLLEAGIDRLSNLYELTFRAQEPPVARYHYRDRFLAIPERSDTQLTFQLLVGGNLEQTLERPAMIDGLECHSYREQTAFLAGHVDELAQPVGAYLHGDAHLPNMLIADNNSVVFVDPRVVWDGNDIGDPGFGDPLYDFATLLHSLHVMSAILHAIDTRQTATLVEVAQTADLLELRSGQLHIRDNPVVDWFSAALSQRLAPEVRGDNWQARLHVGTANALLGWLKYARAVQTGSAWLAIFAAALYHLERGRRMISREEFS